MLSPLFKVRDYKLIDLSRYSVSISWKIGSTGGEVSEKTSELFPVRDPLGKTKTITFGYSKSIEFTLQYTDPSQIPVAGEKDGIIGTYRLKDIPNKADDSDADIKVKVKVDSNGIIGVVSAELVEKKEVIIEVPIEEPKKEEKKEEKKPEDKPEEKKDSDKMDAEPTAPKTKQEKRTKTTNTAVTVETVFEYGLSAQTIQKFKALEDGMKAKDQEATDQANAKNALETYIYNTRDKLGNSWAEFAQESEVSQLNKMFEDTEEWLYNDGADVATPVYKKKLGELTAIAEPIGLRAAEWDTLPGALAALKKTVADLKAEATSGKEQYAHLTAEELKKVVDDADHVISNLNEGGKLDKFQSRKKTENPPFRTSDINERNKNLNASASKILNKPKPAPPKEEKKPEEKKPEEKAGDKTETAEKPANAAPASSDPMDTAD